MHDLDVEMTELIEEMSEIELGQWDEQEKKKDQAKWEADYLSSLADYADNNCDKFEEMRSGYTDIDDLKECKVCKRTFER